jgi:hypothetical protein
MRYYRDLTEIYPREILESTNYYIARGIMTQEFIDKINSTQSYAKQFAEHYEAGKEHVFLISKTEGTMMSDYPDEKITNQKFIDNAYGDILIFGLGIGLVIFPLLDEENVSSITIVEKDSELPSLVEPIIQRFDSFSKVKIINGDAFTHFDKLDRKYDTIYFDIWSKITNESFEEMDSLHELYKPFLKNETSYIDSWRYDVKNTYKSQLDKKNFLKLVNIELDWLKFYSTPESIYNLSEDSDLYSELKPVGYGGGLISLDNCCIPCVITSEKTINGKTKVSDLKTITSTRDKSQNRYSPLEVYWILYPNKREEVVKKLKNLKDKEVVLK